jgi:IS5 family transposase
MNKKQLKIKIYENWYIKLDDVLEKEKIDNKLFNDFLRGKTIPVIDGIKYIYITDFNSFCGLNKLDFKLEKN